MLRLHALLKVTDASHDCLKLNSDFYTYFGITNCYEDDETVSRF